MSEQHTPGRLRLERDPMHFDSMSSIRGGEHREHLGLPDELMIEVGGWSPAQEANARRVKACWDLLVDVPTKEIEAAANYGASWGKTGLELAALTVKIDALRSENASLRAELEAVGAGGVQPLRAFGTGADHAHKNTATQRPVGDDGAQGEHAEAVDAVPAFDAVESQTKRPAAPQDASKKHLEVGETVQPGIAVLSSLPTHWALVPVEPTKEIVEAAFDALPNSSVGGAISRRHRAMLAAAQKAPQQAAPVSTQKPELRVGQVWRTRCGVTAKIEAEMTNSPYPFQCVSGGDRWTVTKDGRFYSKHVEPASYLIELISDVQEGGEA